MDREARRALAEDLTGFEQRTLTVEGFELREGNDGRVQLNGHASVTETPYDMGMYQETIKRGAFTNTLNRGAAVKLLINHAGLPIARTGKNMTLTEDDRGLRVDASLNPDLPLVQELRLTANDGLIDSMSFAFRVVRQSWDDDYENREITEVNLDRGDVSVVTEPANPAASFSLRHAREFLSEMPRDEFVRFMYSIRAADAVLPPSPLTADERIVAKLDDLRSGATISAATMSGLQRVLDLIDASDTNVDKALIVLSDLMGVTNPDIAQDAALDRSAARLDIEKAKAFALRLRGEAA